MKYVRLCVRVIKRVAALLHPELGRQKGVALMLTLIMLAVFSLLGIHTLHLIQNEMVMVRNYEAGSRAFYHAEGNLHKAIAEIRKKPHTPNIVSNTQIIPQSGLCFHVVATAAAGGITKTVEADVKVDSGESMIKNHGVSAPADKENTNVKVMVTNWITSTK